VSPPGLRSIPHVLHVEQLRGADAGDATPELLVEVPHGADEAVHYEELRGRMVGELPAGLADFFFINTDVGAWAIGRAVAAAYVAARPAASVLLLRCLVPRTFVDCNRPASREGGQLTPGIPPYLTHEQDLALLHQRHATYVHAAAQAYELVCGGGGRCVLPHTYGPHSMEISVGPDIVQQLRWAQEPEQLARWQVRPEVALLTRDPDGTLWAPAWAEDLVPAFAEAGFEAKLNTPYDLHPASLGHRWSTAYPGRVFAFEVRRDLLVPRWTPFAEMRTLAEPVGRVAAVVAEGLLSA
jgi:hypothetical protein